VRSHLRSVLDRAIETWAVARTFTIAKASSVGDIQYAHELFAEPIPRASCAEHWRGEASCERHCAISRLKQVTLKSYHTLLINVHSCVCKHVAQIRLFDQLYRRVLKLLREASSHQRLAGTPLQLAARGRPSKLRVRSCRLLAHKEEVIVPEIAVRATATCTCLRVLPSMGRGHAPSDHTLPTSSHLVTGLCVWGVPAHNNPGDERRSLGLETH
jgi:hypothetical protein